mgnify:CR=1 FL=1
MISSTTKTVICPIDGKEKTVYLDTVVFDMKRSTISKGCNDLHGDKRCDECRAKEFKTEPLSLFSDSPTP